MKRCAAVAVARAVQVVPADDLGEVLVVRLVRPAKTTDEPMLDHLAMAVHKVPCQMSGSLESRSNSVGGRVEALAQKVAFAVAEAAVLVADVAALDPQVWAAQILIR